MSDPDVIQNTNPDFTVTHVFSTSDIVGTFDGVTVADNPSIIDTGATPQVTKGGTELFPIDSEFGYIVSDFVGAEEKTLDGIYTEGWAGDLSGEGGEHIGLVVSDAPTDTFQTPAVLGTWLSGLGGNTVKASTEHYSVMQEVLSDQKFPEDPDALYPLDDDLRIVDFEGGVEGVLHDFYVYEMTEALEEAFEHQELGTPTTGLTMDFDRDGIDETYQTGTVIIDGFEVAAVDIGEDGTWDIIDQGLNGYGGDAGIVDILKPNESSITNDIAYGDDYSVTVKDDGKLLYRWGNTIKKPNDIRIEVEMPLPDEWKQVDPETGLLPLFKITSAELATSHTITNNPNDQIRPENFENEAAIGVLPSFTLDPETGNLMSVDDYYAGDGTFYPAGTILLDTAIPGQVAGTLLADIGAASSDLLQGYTNAYYTTLDRAPFTSIPDGSGGYIMGPRWRLQPDKYGQDLPSVVIPDDPSQPPPPTKDEVKYDVGADTLTVINLLDWETDVSPLSISAGFQNSVGSAHEGLSMTQNFDVAFYVKGDIKPATLYDTELIMSYEQMTINDENVAVTGGANDDYLVGQGGNTFTGGAGSDLFVVSYGAIPGQTFNSSTVLDFTAGEDVVGLIGVGADIIENDTAMASTNIGQQVVGGNLEISVDGNLIVTLNGVTEVLDAESFFSSTQSAYPSIGGSGDDLLVGTPNDDLLLGFAGDDTIMALEGDDNILAGVGADKVYGDEGNDTMNGGEGNDMLWGGADDDRVWGLAGDDNLNGNSGDDWLGGDVGNDTINGGDGEDWLWGGADDDRLWGLAGADNIEGDEGADWLGGGDANDTISGGHGDDWLWGDGGDDDLTGGLGADTFAFYTGFGDDTVNDFLSGTDILALDQNLWGGGLTTQQVVSTYANVLGSDVVFDFGSGNEFTLVGVSSTTGLDADILFV